MSRLVFTYGDEQFICGAMVEDSGRFRPVLERSRPWPEAESLIAGQVQLFDSEWAALRWAEQMAVRWVHEHRAPPTERANRPGSRQRRLA